MAEYRYRLDRNWPGGDGSRAVWILLNPSTATETSNDPTIRRCVGFSQRWGVSALVVVNLFALRSTEPRGLAGAADPVGPENDQEIAAALAAVSDQPSCVVCAWGHYAAAGRVAAVLALLAAGDLRPYCLGVTRDGHPRHPLYVPYSTKLQPWSGASQVCAASPDSELQALGGLSPLAPSAAGLEGTAWPIG